FPLGAYPPSLYALLSAFLYGILPRCAAATTSGRAEGVLLSFENADVQFIGRLVALVVAVDPDTFRPLFLKVKHQRVKLAVGGPSPTVDKEFIDLLAAAHAATDLPALKALIGVPSGGELTTASLVRAFIEYMCWALAGGGDTIPFLRGIPPGIVDPAAACLHIMDWYVHKNSKAFGFLGFCVNQPLDEYGAWLSALPFEKFSSRVQEATFPWSWKYPPSEGDIVNMLTPLWKTLMGRIDPELPLVRGNIKILVDNDLVNNECRSMAATLLDMAELERRRDTGGCHVGLCAGGCVKVCLRCLHVDLGTFTWAECPGTAESLNAACPAGTGCSAATLPLQTGAPAGMDAHPSPKRSGDRPDHEHGLAAAEISPRWPRASGDGGARQRAGSTRSSALLSWAGSDALFGPPDRAGFDAVFGSDFNTPTSLASRSRGGASLLFGGNDSDRFGLFDGGAIGPLDSRGGTSRLFDGGDIDLFGFGRKGSSRPVDDSFGRSGAIAKALGEPRGVGSVDQGNPAYPKPTARPQARFHHGGRRLCNSGGEQRQPW
ncbi:hypothetical protein T492DRAFT_885158, partial [Pavlovales sp. CCMP2436]